MSQTFHIVSKDLSRLRWWLGTWVALLAVGVLLKLFESQAAGGGGEEFVLAQVRAILALVRFLTLGLLMARLVHDEPLVGLDWFWLTRPYNRRALLAAKLVIGAAFFVLLPLVTELLVMAAFDAGPRDMLRAGSVFLARDIRWMSGLMVLAVLTPSLVTFAIGLVGSAAALALTLTVFVAVALLTVDLEESVSPVTAFGDPLPALVGTIVFVVVALTVIIYQYRRRRLSRALVLAAAGAIAVVIVPANWPWRFARPPSIDPGAWAHDSVRVAPSVDRSMPPRISSEMAFGRRSRPRHQVSVPVWLTGLPAEYRIQHVAAQSRLEFQDGQVLETQSGPAAFLALSSIYPERSALQGALGELRLASAQEREPAPTAALLTITDDELARYRGRSGRLTATLHYTLQRWRVIGTIPLTEGAALDAHPVRFEIIHVRLPRDGCSLVVRQSQVSSLLSIAEYREFQFVLGNRERREAFAGDRRESGASTGFSAGPLFMSGLIFEGIGGAGFEVKYVALEYPRRFPAPTTRAVIDPAWQAGANLLVVETAFGGVITRTVTLEDFQIAD